MPWRAAVMKAFCSACTQMQWSSERPATWAGSVISAWRPVFSSIRFVQRTQPPALQFRKPSGVPL